MTPEEYCIEQVARRGTDVYYSLLFIKPEQRQVIINLHALYQAMSQILIQCTDPKVAQSKLNWWEEEINRIFSGNATHPIGQALSKDLNQYQLPKELCAGIIKGIEFNLHHTHYPSFADMLHLYHSTASLFYMLIVHSLGELNQQCLIFARDIGVCIGIIQSIQNLRADVANNFIYLPEDEIDKEKISLQEIFQFKLTDSLKQLLSVQAQRARAYYQLALSQLTHADRYRYLNIIIEAELALHLLNEIEKDNFNVFKNKIYLTPLRKLWVAWLTKRREKKVKN